MANDFIYSLATPADDADLRRLLAGNPMPGRLTTTFEREPNYFLGCSVMGPFWQVIIARHAESGELAAMACRSARPHYINGNVQWIGYLSQLRVIDKYRGLWIVSGGMSFIHQLHNDGIVSAYLTTISDENRIALGVLVKKPRAHYPRMQPFAHIHTLGLILQRPRKEIASPYTLQRGSPAQLNAIMAFLREHGAAKQFFPAYTEADFCGPCTRGFDLHDFIIAYWRGKIVGVLGLWDQESYKQTRIHSYNDYLRWLRPAYNLGARILGAQPLPAPGQELRSIYASFICVADNDPDVFRVLLRQAYNLAAERNYAHLILGLTEKDPLLKAAREYANISYHTWACTAAWEDGAAIHSQLDDRIPYIEIATL